MSVGQRNAFHRRLALEINGGFWTGRSWNTPINSPPTSGKLPTLARTLRQWCQFQEFTCNSGVNSRNSLATVVSISGTGPTADRNDSFDVVVHGTMSSHLNLNFLKISSSSNASTKRMGSVPKECISFSAFASVENVQDWAAIFIRCLDCLNVEKWVNNFKRV